MAKFSVTLNLKASSRTTGSAENDSDEFRVPAVNNDGLLFLKLGHKRQDGLSVRWCLQSALVFTWQSPETSQLNSLQSADVLCHHKVHIWSKLSGSSFILSWFLFFFQSVYQVQNMICSPRVTKTNFPPCVLIWCESLSVKLSVAVEDKRHRAAAASQSQMTSLTALQPDAVRHRVHVTVTEPRPPDVSNLIFSMLAFWC